MDTEQCDNKSLEDFHVTMDLDKLTAVLAVKRFRFLRFCGDVRFSRVLAEFAQH